MQLRILDRDIHRILTQASLGNSPCPRPFTDCSATPILMVALLTYTY